jgi:fructosamine-3-kinase
VQALKFDTLGYVKQLTSAGVDPQVAEIHAMTMANAFGMYIDNLVTTEYLDATLDKRFAEFDLRMERRFAEQDSKFAEQGSKIERRFAEQEKRSSDLELAISDKFAEQDSKFDARFNNLELDLGSLKSVARINTAIMFLLLANVALPALSKFLS